MYSIYSTPHTNFENYREDRFLFYTFLFLSTLSSINQPNKESIMQANRMDDRGTDAMKAHFSECQKLVMRQTRRGCFQEFLGCEVRLLTLNVPQDLFVSVSNPIESNGIERGFDLSVQSIYPVLRSLVPLFLTLAVLCLYSLFSQALTEFRYFKGKEEVFHSLEDTDCFCRVCCTSCHP